ncbi:PTS glucose transporter subunit IIA [Corynebacterium sp. ES2794-CONJ1]|nr:PTS glucose transporter subunit IIA [Corynebacterium sp. ES2775-CONJ]MCS4491916.1 PTS glucose transporter subunit IIA [Corynebacterium sp. ES2715-CONJ3]MCS4532021.1 PTS glucose transporter subunit IIA [Corynebacterium sp. ES2730-CONJ]MCU9519422.1 PTS glucose transporter subunit IIA [Corynebacterium sp. ES2794-CONJ1]
MFGFGKKKVKLSAPFSGAVIPIDQVPDAVFAGGMLGEGFAVVPDENIETFEVLSPVTGTIATLFKTLHAFALKTDEGLEVLVHIGLDTVELKGEGFSQLAAKGDKVTAGQPIIRVDAAAVRAAGKDLVTPVVMTNKKQVKSVVVNANRASAQDEIATVSLA